MDLLAGLVQEERPLPPSVKKRQDDLVLRLSQTKSLVPVMPTTAKFLAEMDEIINMAVRNDR